MAIFRSEIGVSFASGEKRKNIIQKPEKSLMRRAAKQFICFCFITTDQGQGQGIGENRKPKASVF
jgi:hypothetical protein